LSNRVELLRPDKLAASGQRLEVFDKVHAAQPGYIGSVLVDLETDGASSHLERGQQIGVAVRVAPHNDRRFRPRPPAAR
jgi:hypothetical protein